MSNKGDLTHFLSLKNSRIIPRIPDCAPSDTGSRIAAVAIGVTRGWVVEFVFVVVVVVVVLEEEFWTDFWFVLFETFGDLLFAFCEEFSEFPIKEN
jgi:hypothetical protein